MEKFKGFLKAIFNKKSGTKILSLFLSLLIMFFAIPSVVFAELAEAIGSIERAKDTEEGYKDIYTYIGDAFEVEGLREESVKHFRLEDGTYVAAQYNYPVHYVDENGKMQDIDNKLSEVPGGMFASKNSRIKFAKKITGNETLFTLHDKGTKITLSLIGAIKGVSGTVTNLDDADEPTKLQKMMNLERLSSSIIYKDILDGVDLEYIAQSQNIKENIIVKERGESYSYSFELKLNGLEAELSENGDIKVINKNTQEIQYTIPAPVVFDSQNEYAPSEFSHYTLSSKGNGKYTLTVTVSAEWMNEPGRAFPVTIDPAIVASDTSVQDTSISSAAPDSSFGNDASLYINIYRFVHWKTTSLPTIPASAYMTSATITMRSSLTNGDYVAAYEVLTDWDESLTWNQYNTTTNPKGKLDSKVIDYNLLRSGFYTWNITPLVQKWYSGSANYGVAFNAAPGESASLSFNSSESTAYANRPALTVTYKDMKGTEPYWSYSSHTAGVAGTGSVNLSTGNLSFAIPTLSTTDSLMPYAPTLVYNSSLSNKNYTYSYTETANTNSYMPYGFKLNICETVIKKSFVDNTGTTKYYYVYADADGTEHGFYVSSTDSSVYIDENGMQKTLTVNSDGNVEITDDSKWTRTFTKKTSNPSSSVSGAWYLTKITDGVGNAIIFTYDSSLRPTKVSIKPKDLSQIDFLDLYYYSTGKLRMIYNSTSKDAVVFRYSSTYSGSISTTSTNYLRQIDYAHGNSSVTLANWENFANSQSNLTNITVDATASYQYNSSGKITSVSDSRIEQKINYLWTGEKVTELRQYADTTLGQRVSYTYGTGYTDVKSTGNDEVLYTSDDIITRYVFDDEGRSKSIYSFAENGTEIYGATVGKYETQENIKNNIKEKTTLGGAPVNYLLNGDFEETSSSTNFSHWEISGAVSRTHQLFD